ncbi:MAG: helix-turn-helix transcriptional regulator [Candidatus Riflebacteria bacterium]|nr:helix-turn-helix transcriptional regulator [Candidatus Riflebacteria bacterium]
MKQLGADEATLKGVGGLETEAAGLEFLVWLVTSRQARLEFVRHGIDPWGIRVLRQARGWVQEELAHKLGLAFSTVNRWENSVTRKTSRPILEVLQRLADFQEGGQPAGGHPTVSTGTRVVSGSCYVVLPEANATLPGFCPQGPRRGWKDRTLSDVVAGKAHLSLAGEG